jgi:hypothetical protein
VLCGLKFIPARARIFYIIDHILFPGPPPGAFGCQSLVYVLMLDFVTAVNHLFMVSFLFRPIGTYRYTLVFNTAVEKTCGELQRFSTSSYILVYF